MVINNMKRYLIWFYLQMKRMIKKPAFVLFLICLPLLSVLIDRLGQGKSAGVTIGVVIEAAQAQQSEAQSQPNAAPQDCDEWNQRLLKLLSEQEGILQFRTYEDKERMIQDVKKGELECAAALPCHLSEKVRTGTWQDAIGIYKTASSDMVEMVKEKIAAAVFTLYSEETYVNYIGQAEGFANAEASGASRAEIAAFAKKAYDTRLLDGSTFDFQYHGEIQYQEEQAVNRQQPQIRSGSEQRVESRSGSERINETTNQPPAGAFRLKGILAVCIFLSGMCGLLTDFQDRKEKRFLRIAPPWLTTAVNIWIPTIYTSAAAFLSLCLTGRFSGQFAEMGKELCCLLFYQFLIVLYCSIMKPILRKQESIAAAIPILTLAGMVCCPVWIRLAVYLPIFRVLEKLFPITYYLLL